MARQAMQGFLALFILIQQDASSIIIMNNVHSTVTSLSLNIASICFAFHSPDGTTISAIVVSDLSRLFAFITCNLSMSYLFISIGAVSMYNYSTKSPAYMTDFIQIITASSVYLIATPCLTIGHWPGLTLSAG